MQGKCALITGSTQGLGLAAAQQFAAAGCHVVLNGFASGDEIAAIRDGIEQAYGVRTLYADADLRIPGHIDAMISAAVEAFGAVDILVNNAVVRHTAPVESFSPERWDEGLAVNLSAAFHTIRLALPAMKQRGWGRIINVSSIYGLRAAPNRVAYVTTKTALLGLTRAVAIETVNQGITCNAICPGSVLTPSIDGRIGELMDTRGLNRDDAVREFLRGKQPTGELVEAAHVADLLVFLCSASANQITGATMPIEGGWLAS